jgi:sulfide:quinone oxidoreductase
MHIVIIGGSFGGLNVAYDLRRLLPHKSHKITVISQDSRFIFIPSLPWVTMGSKTIDDI